MSDILIVEDDRIIAEGIEYSLKKEGFNVFISESISETKKMKNQKFDIILLDLSLPDGSGYDICKEIRAAGDTPVIFITACDEEANVVMGLDMGADDYITKPFRLRELISRINAVLRRRIPNVSGNDNINIGSIRINTSSAKVYKNDKEILLTSLEYRLLLNLAENKSQVLTRSQLLEGIWDVAGDFVNDNTLTVYIKRLREKLEDDPQNPTIIKTVRGLGYKAGE